VTEWMSKQAAQNWLLLTQVVLLGVNAGLVCWYVVVTRKIQHNAVEQAEGLSRPAIVLSGNSNGVVIKNIGSGPAVDVTWNMKFLEVLNGTDDQTSSFGKHSYLAEKEETSLFITTGQIQRAILRNTQACCFECAYKSLGNARYVTTHVFASYEITETFFERKSEPNSRPRVTRN
jgi:hypothetical protein